LSDMEYTLKPEQEMLAFLKQVESAVEWVYQYKYISVIKQLIPIQNSKDFSCTQSDEAGTRIKYKLQEHQSLAVIGGNSNQQYPPFQRS
jgi:hypothetical protein